MEALGKPGEVLLVQEDLRSKKTFFPFQMVESIEDTSAPDASQIIDAIDAERGPTNGDQVAKNLANIRDTWFKSKFGSPTTAEYNALAKSLYDGFTVKQLLRYFGDVRNSSPLARHMELLNPHSTNLYTRSSWTAGSTPFPGDASARLTILKQEVSIQPQDVEKLSARKSSDKHALVDKILQERWHIRTQQEMSSPGELDIWMSQEHLDIMLNHSKGIVIL